MTSRKILNKFTTCPICQCSEGPITTISSSLTAIYLCGVFIFRCANIYLYKLSHIFIWNSSLLLLKILKRWKTCLSVKRAGTRDKPHSREVTNKWHLIKNTPFPWAQYICFLVWILLDSSLHSKSPDLWWSSDYFPLLISTKGLSWRMISPFSQGWEGVD